ncbi:MAG: hypothetical protein WA936_07585, partial [Erythrobacter sp.]
AYSPREGALAAGTPAETLRRVRETHDRTGVGDLKRLPIYGRERICRALRTYLVLVYGYRRSGCDTAAVCRSRKGNRVLL